MEEVNPYEVLLISMLTIVTLAGLGFGGWKLLKLALRIKGKVKKIVIEPTNDADDNFGGYL